MSQYCAPSCILIFSNVRPDVSPGRFAFLKVGGLITVDRGVGLGGYSFNRNQAILGWILWVEHNFRSLFKSLELILAPNYNIESLYAGEHETPTTDQLNTLTLFSYLHSMTQKEVAETRELHIS